MFRVTREINFCYGHRLLNYDGKCRYLHGHNGTAVIAIEAAKHTAVKRLSRVGMSISYRLKLIEWAPVSGRPRP